MSKETCNVVDKPRARRKVKGSHSSCSAATARTETMLRVSRIDMPDTTKENLDVDTNPLQPCLV